jgi:hypothetical protein
MSYLVGRWRMALRHGWWGVPVVVVGFGLMAIGLGAGLAVAVIGAVLAAVGLRLVAHAAKLGWDARQRQSDR